MHGLSAERAASKKFVVLSSTNAALASFISLILKRREVRKNVYIYDSIKIFNLCSSISYFNTFSFDRKKVVIDPRMFFFYPAFREGVEKVDIFSQLRIIADRSAGVKLCRRRWHSSKRGTAVEEKFSFFMPRSRSITHLKKRT